ncbi:MULTISPECIES: hypothetical protein [unclassified Mesorhizobium]|uniref:8-oxoguanine DNA glycosylase n=1 Tax=unclassified Mesorhizobium TaxID=325217 RepID=UPI0015E3C933|nr:MULTISPECIES: hypothetical protein [unclassified Mesorhizobium]
MAVLINQILRDLVDDYHSGSFGTFEERRYSYPNTGAVEKILITCILSSNWVFERATQAADRLFDKFLLGSANVRLPTYSGLESFLTSETVKCRYPKAKAGQLWGSLHALRSLGAPLPNFAQRFDDELRLREYFFENFPGLGLKQSSMFLRDTGVASNLAIVDIHIMWYLNHAEDWAINSLTPKEYLRAEQHLLAMARDLDIPMGVLDSIIWVMVKQLKKNRRSYSCETQYALPLEG